MKISNRYFLPLLIVSFALAASSWAAVPKLEQIKPGVYTLNAINHHTPAAFKSSEAYLNSLQQVTLEIGGQEQFNDLPKLGMKKPYTGYIVLGDRPQKFGVIIDVVGEEKRLYIDRNGDGSFAGETYTLLLNEWQGLQSYWVLGPEPITLQVSYDSLKQTYPIAIEVGGVLNRPGAFLKEKPYLKIAVNTWLLAKIGEPGAEILAAVVDSTNDGRFNDPKDQLFIDYNYNGYFSADEVIAHNRGVKIKTDQGNFSVEWSVYPDKLVIGGK